MAEITLKPGVLALKRLGDVVASALGLALAGPFMLLIALLIKLTSRGPVFFRHPRLGRGGRVFSMLKFRTMYHGVAPLTAADGSRIVLERDPRITPLGRVLRSGLDELPQLWHVLRGDMSLVGPRPDEPHALDLYSDEERLKLLVRPGITGLTQVSGRNQLPWHDRLKLDIEYVRNLSLLQDARIIALTALELVRSHESTAAQPAPPDTGAAAGK